MRNTERWARCCATLLVAVAIAAGVVLFEETAGAAASVDLGTADSFAVLAGAGVTNTGPSLISGNLGTCPTPAVTGFPPGIVQSGMIHANDALACSAQSDLTIAYNSAAGRAPDTTFGGPTDLGSRMLVAGVYRSASSYSLTGTLTLDAQTDPDAVWIFQASSSLITATNSRIALINGAQACNVFWQVGSSATLGVDSVFAGTILALTSITANTNAVISGRLLARNGATTLDSNQVRRSGCAAPTATTTSSTVVPGVTTTTTTAGPGATTTTTPATTTSTTMIGATTTTRFTATSTTLAGPGVTATTTTLAATPGGTTTTSATTSAPAAPAPTNTALVNGRSGPGGPAASAAPARQPAPSANPGVTIAAPNAATSGSLPRTGEATPELALLGGLLVVLGGAFRALAIRRGSEGAVVTSRRRNF